MKLIVNFRLVSGKHFIYCHLRFLGTIWQILSTLWENISNKTFLHDKNHDKMCRNLWRINSGGLLLANLEGEGALWVAMIVVLISHTDISPNAAASCRLCAWVRGIKFESVLDQSAAASPELTHSSVCEWSLETQLHLLDNRTTAAELTCSVWISGTVSLFSVWRVEKAEQEDESEHGEGVYETANSNMFVSSWWITIIMSRAKNTKTQLQLQFQCFQLNHRNSSSFRQKIRL